MTKRPAVRYFFIFLFDKYSYSYTKLFTTEIEHCYLSIEQCKVTLGNYMYTYNITNIISSVSLTSLSTLVGKMSGVESDIGTRNRKVAFRLLELLW